MMRKVLTYAMLFVILCTVFCSCSNDEKISDATEADNNILESELLLKISAFNDSAINSKIQTRGWIKPGAWKRAQVIAADIAGGVSGGKAGFGIGSFFSPAGAGAGAVIGAIVGAGCGSYMAYANAYWTRAALKMDMTPQKATLAYASVLKEGNIENSVPKDIIVDYPIEDKDITLMGAKHNLVLKKLIDNDIKLEKVEDCFTKEELAVINSDEYQKVFDKTMSAISNNNDILKIEGDDVTTKVMNLFYEILQKYPDNNDDIEYIINKYIEVIKKSNEISDVDKKNIYSGLSIAASSSEFWEQMELK